jgi:uracil-DNA glycosylase
MSIHNCWQPIFNQFNIKIDELYEDTVYPPKDKLYRVFEMDVKEIKILLLGQDPYHKKGQANGLSFSVNNGIKIPPSLRNIFKDLLLEFPERKYNFITGNLEKWFYKEKIFLLNASLSVIEGKPESHVKIWENFTNAVIKFISDNNDNCVFLLLGNFAKSKEKYITNKTHIIKGTHPSPLAQRGNDKFIGSNIFNNIETLLGYEIDWQN